ncbi:chromate efflux transporter [Dactylosporangium cerinum]|uniref:Chromate efflux transporter n=1 Tax=Dactylosporangium cerinum TaxID=1434730 RepID=A0ABV9WHY3_9ACTN
MTAAQPSDPDDLTTGPHPPHVSLRTIMTQWTRIGITGFGGPPAHISLLRQLCVTKRGWINAHEFEDGIAATNLLPGPASTQLAIFCAWRLRGWVGGLLGGVCFIVPGLIVILGLSVLLLSWHPAPAVIGAAAGAGAAVAPVAVQAGASLVPASWQRTGATRGGRARWVAYAAVSAAAAMLLGPWLVLVLLAAGVVEAACQGHRLRITRAPLPGLALAGWASVGTLGSVAWTALKVGALSYGGGFVIIPLMRADAVDRHHWLTGDEFLYAVALGQITPGPVVQTVSVIGYAAAGIAGGLLAAVVAFTPSFVFVLGGGRHFDRLRANPAAQAFLSGAGPAAIGAILGSSVLLARSISHPWQWPILALAAIWLLVFKRGVVSALIGAAALGVAAALVGLPLH